MLQENKLEPELDHMRGMATYSYADMRRKDVDVAASSKTFVEAINRHVIGPNVSDYGVLNQIVYKSLMGKQKLMFGDMSELLYRRILGNSLTLAELKDVFRFLTEQLKKMEQPTSYREAAHNFLPHVFQAPKDLYVAALLKEAFQAATSVCAYVGVHHYVPVQKYWVR